MVLEESLERATGTKNGIIAHTLKNIRKCVQDWSRVIICYYPKWTFGTTSWHKVGHEAEWTLEFIRKWFAKHISVPVAKKIRIIYGG